MYSIRLANSMKPQPVNNDMKMMMITMIMIDDVDDDDIDKLMMM